MSPDRSPGKAFTGPSRSFSPGENNGTPETDGLAAAQGSAPGAAPAGERGLHVLFRHAPPVRLSLCLRDSAREGRGDGPRALVAGLYFYRHPRLDSAIPGRKRKPLPGGVAAGPDGSRRALPGQGILQFLLDVACRSCCVSSFFDLV